MVQGLLAVPRPFSGLLDQNYFHDTTKTLPAPPLFFLFLLKTSQGSHLSLLLECFPLLQHEKELRARGVLMSSVRVHVLSAFPSSQVETIIHLWVTASLNAITAKPQEMHGIHKRLILPHLIYFLHCFLLLTLNCDHS